MSIIKKNVEEKDYYGLFSLQWHLTNKCQNHCRHCYIDPSFRLQQELSLDGCKKIVDDFINVFGEYNLSRSVSLTGGDPLLSKNLRFLIEYIRGKKENTEINILGNPELLNDEWIEFLEGKNITYYQLSIDGVEKTHDFFRGKGSFKRTITALKRLSKSKIKPIVMTTISLLNYKEAKLIAKLVIDYGAFRWDFARLVPTSENIRVSFIPPEEYHKFLEDMMNFYKKNGYSEMQIGRKEPLWVLVDPISFHQKNCNCGTEKNIVDGCSLGTLSFTVLPNGEVIGCRRHLGSLIGKVPEQSFREIFLNSRRLNDLRKFEKIEKCNKCKWLYHCRGCRAVAYGRSKTIYSPDPQCWLEK